MSDAVCLCWCAVAAARIVSEGSGKQTTELWKLLSIQSYGGSVVVV